MTANGDALAKTLAPAIGESQAIRHACSLICRHATTHHAYAEAACNRPLSSWEEQRIDMLESRYAELETLYHELRERLEKEEK